MAFHTLMNNSTIQTTSTETKLENIQLHVLGLGAQKQELWKGLNVEAFMEAFVDCVECHYHVYKEGGVPPPLIETTLMFEYGGDGNIRGVINDWDIAAHVEKNGESQLWKAYHPGSIPFMARDLLVDGTPPPVLYCHNLESFFYILVWAAVNYHFGDDEARKIDLIITGWDASTLAGARDIKGNFITHRLDFKAQMLQRMDPRNHVFLPWIDSIWSLFLKAHLGREISETPNAWDHATLGGHITFEKFMQAIGREPR